MRKVISFILCLALIISCFMTTFAAEEKAIGTTIKLTSTSGTVTIKDRAGKVKTNKTGMKLLAGYTITTDQRSYAYVTLDKSKAIKLDANTKVEFQKSGKKLEIFLSEGQIYFDVTEKLTNDESLNIRTNTIATGIRGTIGYATQNMLTILEGSAEVLTLSTNEVTTVDAGYMLVVTEITEKPGEQQGEEQEQQGESQEQKEEETELIPLMPEEVPGFAAEEIKSNENTQERLNQSIGENDVQEIVGGADEKLAADEQKAEEDAKKQADEDAKKEAEQKSTDYALGTRNNFSLNYLENNVEKYESDTVSGENTTYYVDEKKDTENNSGNYSYAEEYTPPEKTYSVSLPKNMTASDGTLLGGFRTISGSSLENKKAGDTVYLVMDQYVKQEPQPLFTMALLGATPEVEEPDLPFKLRPNAIDGLELIEVYSQTSDIEPALEATVTEGGVVYDVYRTYFKYTLSSDSAPVIYTNVEIYDDDYLSYIPSFLADTNHVHQISVFGASGNIRNISVADTQTLILSEAWVTVQNNITNAGVVSVISNSSISTELNTRIYNTGSMNLLEGDMTNRGIIDNYGTINISYPFVFRNWERINNHDALTIDNTRLESESESADNTSSLYNYGEISLIGSKENQGYIWASNYFYNAGNITGEGNTAIYNNGSFESTGTSKIGTNIKYIADVDRGAVYTGPAVINIYDYSSASGWTTTSSISCQSTQTLEQALGTELSKKTWLINTAGEDTDSEYSVFYNDYKIESPVLNLYKSFTIDTPEYIGMPADPIQGDQQNVGNPPNFVLIARAISGASLSIPQNQNTAIIAVDKVPGIDATIICSEASIEKVGTVTHDGTNPVTSTGSEYDDEASEWLWYVALNAEEYSTDYYEISNITSDIKLYADVQFTQATLLSALSDALDDTEHITNVAIAYTSGQEVSETDCNFTVHENQTLTVDSDIAFTGVVTNNGFLFASKSNVVFANDVVNNGTMGAYGEIYNSGTEEEYREEATISIYKSFINQGKFDIYCGALNINTEAEFSNTGRITVNYGIIENSGLMESNSNIGIRYTNQYDGNRGTYSGPAVINFMLFNAEKKEYIVTYCAIINSNIALANTSDNDVKKLFESYNWSVLDDNELIDYSTDEAINAPIVDLYGSEKGPIYSVSLPNNVANVISFSAISNKVYEGESYSFDVEINPQSMSAVRLMDGNDHKWTISETTTIAIEEIFDTTTIYADYIYNIVNDSDSLAGELLNDINHTKTVYALIDAPSSVSFENLTVSEGQSFAIESKDYHDALDSSEEYYSVFNKDISFTSLTVENGGYLLFGGVNATNNGTMILEEGSTVEFEYTTLINNGTVIENTEIDGLKSSIENNGKYESSMPVGINSDYMQTLTFTNNDSDAVYSGPAVVHFLILDDSSHYLTTNSNVTLASINDDETLSDYYNNYEWVSYPYDLSASPEKYSLEKDTVGLPYLELLGTAKGQSYSITLPDNVYLNDQQQTTIAAVKTISGSSLDNLSFGDKVYIAVDNYNIVGSTDNPQTYELGLFFQGSMGNGDNSNYIREISIDNDTDSIDAIEGYDVTRSYYEITVLTGGAIVARASIIDQSKVEIIPSLFDDDNIVLVSILTNCSIDSDFTINAGQILQIDYQSTVTLASDASITNKGQIQVENLSKLIIEEGAKLINNSDSYLYLIENGILQNDGEIDNYGIIDPQTGISGNGTLNDYSEQ